jgi:hypothetical protein
MAVRLSNLRAIRPLPPPPPKIPGTHFCYRPRRPQGHGAARRIRSIEKSNTLIGNRSRYLPACRIMPQPTTLSRAPYLYLTIQCNISCQYQIVWQVAAIKQRTGDNNENVCINNQFLYLEIQIWRYPHSDCDFASLKQCLLCVCIMICRCRCGPFLPIFPKNSGTE